MINEYVEAPMTATTFSKESRPELIETLLQQKLSIIGWLPSLFLLSVRNGILIVYLRL